MSLQAKDAGVTAQQAAALVNQTSFYDPASGAVASTALMNVYGTADQALSRDACNCDSCL